MNGLSPQTEAIFEDISKIDCIKNYLLIGGTALAIQIDHRHSEDLDFCIWKKSKQDKTQVQWPVIFKELSALGEVKKNLLGFDHCDFYLNGVKITFFITEKKEPENLKRIPLLNHIAVADPTSIGIMKLDVLQYRATHRDYYDIYSLLQSGIGLDTLIAGTKKYSEYKFKTREIESILVNGTHFTEDKQFSKLQPKYDVSLKDIELFLTEKVRKIHKAMPYHASDKLAAISKEVKSSELPVNQQNTKIQRP